MAAAPKPRMEEFLQPAIVEAVYAAIAADARARTLAAKVRVIEIELLSLHPVWVSAEFQEGPEPERIRDPQLLYLADEAEAAAHYARKRTELERAGFQIEGDSCPALEAEQEKNRAQRTLIDTVAASVPAFHANTADRILSSNDALGNWKEYCELLTGLVVRLTRGRDPKVRRRV